MHIISRRTLKDAAAGRRDLEAALDVWYRIAKAAEWRNLAEVKQTWASADYVNPYTVFNIKGNNYRLITKIEYRFGIVYIREVLTHTEYDREKWKKEKKEGKKQ
jgi:mRNA interferase HigB